MKCAVIQKYGKASSVLEIKNVDVPRPRKNEVLVRQHASSVNPIDWRMRAGYGRVLFTKIRGFELPLILGRDVAGEVVELGKGVRKFSVGEMVYGVSTSKAQGAYAEYVICSVNEVTQLPSSLSYEHAASFPYVACTVWDSLVTKAGLSEKNCRGKKVFIQGGSGGIGALAIQLLKSWGAYVATTCHQSNVESILKLGADKVIDYTSECYVSSLSNFDVVLETVGGSYEDKSLRVLRKDGKGVLVTLIHPLLTTFDELGMLRGAIKNVGQYLHQKSLAKSRCINRYYWSTFKPSQSALSTIKFLIEEGKIRPHIDRVFDLSEIAQAHEYCEQGNANGKVIIAI